MRIQGLSSIRTGQRVSLPGTSFPQIVRRRAPVDATKVAVRRADGTILTLGDLPAPDIRWTNHRKRLVLDSIDLGLLAPATARTRYGLTEEELGEWRAMAGSGQTPEIWRERPIVAQGCGPVVAAGLEVDVAAGRLTVAGEEVHLSEAEWAILGALVEAGGAIVTNAMLMGVLYGTRRIRGRKIIDVLVCRIRQKLGAGAQVVDAVWGRGYRFLAEAPVPVAVSA